MTDDQIDKQNWNNIKNSAWELIKSFPRRLVKYVEENSDHSKPIEERAWIVRRTNPANPGDIREYLPKFMW